jgi:flagellar biosynthesis/type III secretory pathway M-ring protein FliF/YscJ
MKKLWSGIKNITSKGWEALKKLPGWAFFALLLLLAICWWLIRKAMVLKARAKLVEKMNEIETTKKVQIEAAKKIHSEAGSKIKERFDEKLVDLEEEKKRLDEELSKGPAAIAKEWKEYLGEGT